MRVGDSPGLPRNTTRSVADRIKGITLNEGITDGLESSDSELSSNESDLHLNNNLKRGRPRTRSLRTPLPLDPFQRNTLRIIGQYLSNLGLKNTTEQLVAESGCSIESPSALRLRALVQQRLWGRAADVLERMRSSIAEETYEKTRVLLVEEQVKERLSNKDTFGALRLLRNDYPKNSTFASRREYLSTLVFQDPDKVAADFRSRDAAETVDIVLQCLHKIMPSDVLLPPERLENLLRQAWSHQTDACALHLDEDSRQSPSIRDFVLRDHRCSASSFPSHCSQVFNEHKAEVWCLQFSPCGRFLATGAKSPYIFVWRLENPAAMELRLYRRLLPPRDISGITALSWSHDSRILAVAAGEGHPTGVLLFNIYAGTLSAVINAQGDRFSSVAFFGNNSHRLVCGDMFGNFQLHDADNPTSIIKTFPGFRIRCLYSMKDGHTVIGADTHNRIRAYDFDTDMDKTLIRENSGIMYFTLDKSEEQCLITTKSEGLKLWCLKSLNFIRAFYGSLHNEFVISSSFGGLNGDFIASGSEDSKLVIWNRRQEQPIHVMEDHIGSVNAVSWNPVYHGMLASAGDDGTVRIWLPESYRKLKIPE